MTGREKEAYDLIKKADSKINTGFFGSLFSSKSSRLEEALDLLEKAAHIFKLVQKWSEAGNTFERCGNIEQELSADAAKYYIEASHCFSFVDSDKSLAAKNKALEFYVQHGRFQLAGKIMKEMAEKLQEEKKFDAAAKAYKKSAEYYSMESMNSKSYQQEVLIKYADLVCSSIEEDKKMDSELFKEVFNIYEKIAFSYLNIPLLKSGAKDYFFKAACTHLAFGNDYSKFENKYKEYLSEDPTMIDSREDVFLKKVIEALKTRDAKLFEEAESYYKKYSDLDKWRITVFRRIGLNTIGDSLAEEDFTG